MENQNIYGKIPAEFKNEITEIILNSKQIRIEKIISKGHYSPDKFWYDQQENEWVLVLKGESRLIFDDDKIVELTTGDYINIPAHKKHRVDWTTPETETIWLAVFYK